MNRVSRIGIVLGLCLALLSFLFMSRSWAAASDLFISEYIEGSSNNKALEFYNGTGSTIDLGAGGYVVEFYFNGAPTAATTISLTGSVASGDVYVLAQEFATSAVLAVADQANGGIWYNGDDAVVLRKSGIVVDAIGQVGFDPGSEWSGGGIGTQNETLRRKAAVCAGDANPNDAFDPASEWDGFLLDDFSGLGSHSATCIDVPPTVQSTIPAGGAVNVAQDADITITFSEPVTVTAGAFSLACPDGSPVAFDVSPTLPLSDTIFTLDPSGDLPAGVTCTAGVSAAAVSDLDGGDDPLAEDYGWSFTVLDPANPCAPADTPIHAVQGSGGSTPLVTQLVTIEGIVVADYQDTNLNGFYVQEEDADADGDPQTSEGIFVFEGGSSVPVAVGDRVQVSGTADEFFDQTQVDTVTEVIVCSSGEPLPSSAVVTLPVTVTTSSDLSLAQDEIDAYFEQAEGMLVTVPESLAVAEHFELSRFGQIVLAQGERLRQFTDANQPDAAGYIAHQIDVARRTLILDDDNSLQNSALVNGVPIFLPQPGFSITNTVRAGDTIAGLSGVLDYSFGEWRVRPVAEVYSYTFTSANPRPPAPAAPGDGALRVVSMNVLNYFDTLDLGPNICGPLGNVECRGADSAAELTRQTDKLVAAICGAAGDIVGLMEIENDATSSLETLLAEINQSCGPYDYVNSGVIGTDAIKVALIYNTATITTTGSFAVLDTAAFVDPNSSGFPKNRPALAQTFTQLSSGESLVVAVNHLKSKGSGCGGGDDDTTTGQGNCNGTRAAAAAELATWLAGDPTGSGVERVLIIGDLNAYRNEDPLVALENAGYTDLIDLFGGAAAYSYLFDGQLGYLDHALANGALRPYVTGVSEWHVNADEVNLLDYNDPVQDASEAFFEAKPAALPLYEPDPFRSSDHDPVLIDLNFSARLYLPFLADS